MYGAESRKASRKEKKMTKNKKPESTLKYDNYGRTL
jgi:hypothetical protein